MSGNGCIRYYLHWIPDSYKGSVASDGRWIFPVRVQRVTWEQGSWLLPKQR